MPTVLSLNASAGDTLGPRGERTGMHKVPVPSAELRDPGPRKGGLGSGVIGDFIGSSKHHGGDSQAVYAFAREEIDRWAEDLGCELVNGAFGENLTTSGLGVDAALIGERWQVGDAAVLAVCGPRVPCATFALSMGVERWVERFADRGRTGAYLSVESPGTVRTGDKIVVIERPEHDIDVPTVFRALQGDREAAARTIAAGCLGPVEHAAVERKHPTL